MRSILHKVVGQRGAALLTVLLFMVLTFILIVTMLGVAGNEIVMSGLQRDSIRALEHALAGVEEAVRRIEEGHDYTPGFVGSLAPGIDVKVINRKPLPAGAVLEIQSDATVGIAKRKVSQLVTAINMLWPPNVFAGQAVSSKASGGDIASGDTYSQTYVRFQELPSYADQTEPGLVYAGWRIGKCNDPDKGCSPSEIPPCYTHKECVDMAAQLAAQGKLTPEDKKKVENWYPAQRLSAYTTDSIGQDLVQYTNACPAGDGSSLPGVVLPAGARAPSGEDLSGKPMYGFDKDDKTWAGDPIESQAVTGNLPCGLPYRWVNAPFAPFDTEDNDPTSQPNTSGPPCPGDSGTSCIYFKVIVYNQWLDNYWRFDGQTVEKRNGEACDVVDGSIVQPCLPSVKQPNLVGYPEFAAVLPFPDFSALKENWDRCVTQTAVEDCETDPSGTVNSSDFGFCDNPPTCDGPSTRFMIVLLDIAGGTKDWTVNGMNPDPGHGLLLIDAGGTGKATLSGVFNYYGTVLVNGELEIGAGNVEIWGGLIARSASKISGSLVVHAGGLVSGAPVGNAKVERQSWWER